MRTKSEGVCPLARERSRSKAPRVLGTRTVIRCEGTGVGQYSTIVRHFYRSTLPQMNRSISRVDRERVAAAIELAMNFILANLALGGNRHIEINVAVAGVQADIGGQFAGDFERNVAVASLKPPGCGQRRPRRRAHFYVTIARLQFEFIEAAI